MREAPGKIPETLPNTRFASCSIQVDVIDRPDIRLYDSSIGQLIGQFTVIDPVYLVGSNVWLRAVFGQSPRPGTLDYDIIFSSNESADEFVKASICRLNSGLPKGMSFSRGENGFGSGRIIHPNGTPLVDAWALDENESISEALMEFPHPYQRAAYQVPSRGTMVGALIRLVHDEMHDGRSFRKGDSRIKQDRRYPGRRTAAQVNDDSLDDFLNRIEIMNSALSPSRKAKR